MVIIHSYVSLPEGNSYTIDFEQDHQPSSTHFHDWDWAFRMSLLRKGFRGAAWQRARTFSFSAAGFKRLTWHKMTN
jgi:hypothetical protein